MGGRPEEGARLVWPRRRLLPPSKPQTPDQRIGRAPLQAQRHVLRADALDYQTRAAHTASIALSSTVGAIPAAAPALETGRYPPVMIFAFVLAAAAVGHVHMPRSPSYQFSMSESSSAICRHSTTLSRHLPPCRSSTARIRHRGCSDSAYRLGLVRADKARPTAGDWEPPSAHRALRLRPHGDGSQPLAG